MVLWLHTQACYPSYEGTGIEWIKDDYNAYKFIQALKGNQLNGYARLTRPNGYQVKIDASDTDGAYTVFGEWGAQKLANMGLNPITLVPVPSSDCLAFDTDEKGKLIAEAIAQHRRNATVALSLCWKEQRPKASKGGTRNAVALQANLRVRTTPPLNEVVLVDDVVTTGGHLLACANALRAKGYKVERAICAARTVHAQPESGMFQERLIDIEAPGAVV